MEETRTAFGNLLNIRVSSLRVMYPGRKKDRRLWRRSRVFPEIREAACKSRECEQQEKLQRAGAELWNLDKPVFENSASDIKVILGFDWASVMSWADPQRETFQAKVDV